MMVKNPLQQTPGKPNVMFTLRGHAGNVWGRAIPEFLLNLIIPSSFHCTRIAFFNSYFGCGQGRILHIRQ